MIHRTGNRRLGQGVRAGVAALLLLAYCPQTDAQAPANPNPTPQAPGTDDTIEAGEAEAVVPARRLVKWNEYEGPFFTIRAGGGLLYEYAAYAQDENSKKQFTLAPTPKLRDARLLLKG